MATTEMNCLASGGGTKTYEHRGPLSDTRVDCGFKARIIMIYDDNYYNGGHTAVCYNADISATTFSLQWNGSPSTRTIGSGEQIGQVEDTYFTLPNGAYYSSSAQIIAME